jgi:hypothetical protein
MPKIPLYTCDGRLIRMIDTDDVSALGQHAKAVKNKRLNVTRVIMKNVDQEYIQRHERKRGQHFEQHLANGTVHALLGVRGSR